MSAENQSRSRILNFPVPVATDHREYTVTENCYLIFAQKPCFGCTLVNVEKAEEGLIYKGGLRMNADFIKQTIALQANEGINLLTLMGGEPLTVKGFEDVIDWISNKTDITCLVYSSSAYFFKPSGELSRKFGEYEAVGMFDKNYFLASVDRLILNKKGVPPDDDSSATKSYWGLKLIEELAQRGYKDVAIHQTMRADNLDETLPLYQWAEDHGVKFSCCPMVWQPYVSRGVSENFYNRHLTEDDKLKLHEIIDVLVGEETARMKDGKDRSLIPSSAFLRLIPEYGAENVLSCRVHRQGMQPNTQDVNTGGQIRWCIAQNTAEGGLNCVGCHYIGIDRGKSDYWQFEPLAEELKPGDIRWLNYHVWMKDPNFDATRRNIAFEVIDNQGNLIALSNRRK